MKPLHKACCSSLAQVSLILTKLEFHKDETLYQRSGISRHVRHILDHYLALKNGLENNHIDYNQRNRDGKVESDIEFATEVISYLNNWLGTLEDNNLKLTIESEIDIDEQINASFESNQDRELLNIINHTIHHTAYIKLIANKFEIEIPEQIGIAPSTATYLREESIGN